MNLADKRAKKNIRRRKLKKNRKKCHGNETACVKVHPNRPPRKVEYQQPVYIPIKRKRSWWEKIKDWLNNFLP